MPKRTRLYRDGLLEDLRDPELAAHYLNVALEDSDEMFVDSLRDVAEANRCPLPGAGVSPDVPAVLAVLRALRLHLALASGAASPVESVSVHDSCLGDFERDRRP